MNELERRVLPIQDIAIEQRTFKRADGTEETRDVIAGKAVVFNQLSEVLGFFREIIAPNAFDGCDMSDVVCLKNHDNNIPLGRTPDGLTFEVRSDGMYFVSVPPNTTTAKDAMEEIRTRNITGCSFQFSIAPDGQAWSTDPDTGGEIRTVTKIHKLYDVGPVTMPAYKQTSVNTEVAKRSFEQYKREAVQPEPTPAPQPEPTPEPQPEVIDTWPAWERKKQAYL